MKVKDQITMVVVVFRAIKYAKITIESFREYYKDVKIILVNGSPPEDPCTKYCYDLKKKDGNLVLIDLKKNHAHGPSLNIGMKEVKTPFAYICDSDVRMFKAGMLEDMMELIKDEESYGVGYTIFTDEFGAGIRSLHRGDKRKKNEVIYLHPMACLVRVESYKKFPEFNFYGAPFAEAMAAIKDTGEPEKYIKHLNIKSYAQHYSGGTRAEFGDWPGRGPAK